MKDMLFTDKTSLVILDFIKMLNINLLLYLNYLWYTIKFLNKNVTNLLINETVFLTKYYSRNENIWQDGFLFDFLQKKTVDLWVRKFVIYTGFIFSERLMFDTVVRIYIDNLIWPLHNNSYLENDNAYETLSVLLYLYAILFLTIIFIVNLL